MVNKARTLKVSIVLTLLASALSVLIGIVAPWLLLSVAALWPPLFGTFGWIGLLVTGCLFAYIWISRIGRQIDFLEPIYFVSLLFLLVFFLRPLQIGYDPGVRNRLMPQEPWLFQQALLLGALGFFCFYIGYRSNVGSKIGSRIPKPSGQWQQGRVIQIAFAYVLVGIAAYSLAVARSGGIDMFIRTARGRTLIREAGNWWIGSLRVLLEVAAVILASYFIRTKRLGIFALICLGLSTASGFLLGGRAGVLVILVTIVGVFYYLRYYRRERALSGAMVLGLFATVAVLFIVMMGATRAYIQRGGDVSVALTPKDLVQGDVASSFVDEFGQFDWFVIVLDITPSSMPFQYGLTFLSFFTQFAPRVLWPEKPLPISFVINTFVGGPGTGTPSSLVGELYLNFNIPGIVVGMFIFGVLLKAVYSYLQDDLENPAVVLIYAYVFASLHSFFTRSFAPKMFGFVLFMVPVLFALRFIGQRVEVRKMRWQEKTN